MDPEVLPAKGQLPHDEACRSLRTLFSVNSQLQSQIASETHVALFRPSWKRKPFLIFVFRVWSWRMFIWSQWCAWSSGFRRKVATAPSFLVAIPRVPVAKCDYEPGFFEPCTSLPHDLLLSCLLYVAPYSRPVPYSRHPPYSRHFFNDTHENDCVWALFPIAVSGDHSSTQVCKEILSILSIFFGEAS